MLKGTKVSVLTLGGLLAVAQLTSCGDPQLAPDQAISPSETGSGTNSTATGPGPAVPGPTVGPNPGPGPMVTNSMGQPVPVPPSIPPGATVITDPTTGMTTVIDASGNPVPVAPPTSTVPGPTPTVPGTVPVPTMPQGTGGMGVTPDPIGGAGMGTGGSTPVDPNSAPPGYWVQDDWHGCAWTGVGTAGVSTIMPQDFTAQAAGEPYCVSGSVGAEPEYQSVALLGFNVNEPTSASCTYEPVDVNAEGPPTVVPTSTGIAVDFVKQGANTGFTLRIQLQGPNGHKEGAVGAADRWCATIEEVQGKVHVPYSDFTPSCWEMTPELKGTPYAFQPISAVVFLVPGAPAATPFDFCVNGFTYGDMAEDAPSGTAMAGDQTGTVGGPSNDDLDFDRKKVLVGGENYIIQNNNWGNPAGSDCILSYVNNSFTVDTCTGSGQSAPAAFPSIYIGANGNTANGVLSTSTTDEMPIQISNIANIATTFRYSGGSGSYNATYDIWFANAPPAVEYGDGIDGFVMVWLRDPGDRQPIGSDMGAVTIAGQSWNVWVGPRGDGPEGYNDAPVVSFVNPTQDDNSRAQSFVDVNLKEFLTAAGGYGIGANMYLTDVFAGFEIWNGGQGLKVDEFKAVVTPN
jgi:hypothetical protein